MLVGNKFELIAPALDGASPSASSTVSMLCSTANLPGLHFMTNELRIFGEYSERPNAIIYPQIQFTFYMDNDLSAKRYFEQWANMVFDRETRTSKYYDDYTRDIELVVYNKAEEEVERFKLFECYPKTIGDLNLDYHNNSVASLTVTMVYKWWQSSQSENWKGNNANSEQSSDNMPNFGYEGLGLNSESFMNSTGSTITGNGLPGVLNSFNDSNLDMQGAIEGLGSQMNTTLVRGFKKSNDYMDFSDLGSSLSGQFKDSIGSLSSRFSNLGGNVSLLGSSLNNPSLPINNIGLDINNIATQTVMFGNLLSQIGPSQNLGGVSGNIIQMSNQLMNVSSVNQTPAFFQSIASGFNQIGSMIGQTNGNFVNSSLINSATSNSFSQVSQNYFSAGSLMSRVAGVIGK